VMRMLLGTGARVAIAGIGAGLVLSFALTRLVATQLYGLTPTDPVTMLGASTLLFAVALLASFIPAWRATRIDPVVALRQR
jgi:putative ABC transport system permease protein